MVLICTVEWLVLCGFARMAYYTDLTDEQYAIILPMLPTQQSMGRPRKIAFRVILNAIFYVLRGGIPWRMLPNDFPPWQTVYYYYNTWSKLGLFTAINERLVKDVRVAAGRNEQPSAVIIDSKTSPNAAKAKDKGYDAGKKTKGRKWHIGVDVLGLLLLCRITSASIQDRDGAKLLLSVLNEKFPGLLKIWADGGYRGKLVQWVAKTFAFVLEIILRPTKAFKVCPWRWIVERTFGWLNWQRRLSKDYEYLPRNQQAWIYLASINYLLHRLAPE